MFERIEIVGSGRVGTAMAARLRERGLTLVEDRADLVVLCVPDSAVAEVAASRAPGDAWICHVSGGLPLSALDPHERRFAVHPLQTFTSRPVSEAERAAQFEGAWCAVTAETPEALACARWLVETLGLRPFELADVARPLYHAGAAMASNYLVTLERAAASLLEAAGAPREALVPLMKRTIDNGFELTGPIARGDWSTIERHREAIRAARPELEHLYDTLADATVAVAL
jgi:predicted short-subunit dehydrogenase-like oxidoreductase (DUF2520 family)